MYIQEVLKLKQLIYAAVWIISVLAGDSQIISLRTATQLLLKEFLKVLHQHSENFKTSRTCSVP